MRIQSAAAICALLLATTVWSSEKPSLEDLHWMVGHWVAMSGDPESGYELKDPESGNEEVWTSPKGGVMVGLGRTVRPDGSAFFEFLRIEERPEGIVLLASPMGEGTTEFPLVALDGQSVVFENPEHDMPQRINYWREQEANILHAEVVGRQRSDLIVRDFSVWQLVK